MSPSIPNHSYVLVHRWLINAFIKEGKRLLIRHETFGLIVKTVAIVDHHGFIWVKGENAVSLSVEQIGPIKTAQVVGVILTTIHP